MNLKFKKLQTKNFLLDRVTIEDVKEILDLRSDPVVLTHLLRDPMQSEEEAGEFIRNLDKMIDDQSGFNWAIREAPGSELMGTIGFYNIKKSHYRLEIGYTLRAKFHRKGIMSECIIAVIQYAFNEMKAHSIAAEIGPKNKASRRLLEKTGFRLEAHFTEDYYYNGEFSDSQIFSLLQKWFIV
mgnify:CR=1 FL=1